MNMKKTSYNAINVGVLSPIEKYRNKVEKEPKKKILNFSNIGTNSLYSICSSLIYILRILKKKWDKNKTIDRLSCPFIRKR